MKAPLHEEAVPFTLPGGITKGPSMNDFVDRTKNAAMKPHHSVHFSSSATRIRTWKMLESESSALPFGDSALNNMFIIIQDCKNVKHFFKKYLKFYFLFPKGNDIIIRSGFALWMEERLCIHLPAESASARPMRMENCHWQES